MKNSLQFYQIPLPNIESITNNWISPQKFIRVYVSMRLQNHLSEYFIDQNLGYFTYSDKHSKIKVSMTANSFFTYLFSFFYFSHQVYFSKGIRIWEINLRKKLYSMPIFKLFTIVRTFFLDLVNWEFYGCKLYLEFTLFFGLHSSKEW